MTSSVFWLSYNSLEILHNVTIEEFDFQRSKNRHLSEIKFGNSKTYLHLILFFILWPNLPNFRFKFSKCTQNTLSIFICSKNVTMGVKNRKGWGFSCKSTGEFHLQVCNKNLQALLNHYDKHYDRENIQNTTTNQYKFWQTIFKTVLNLNHWLFLLILKTWTSLSAKTAP